MIGTRKTAAIRTKLPRSGGPRSREGKVRASANARRHGLSLSVLADSRLDAEVRELAKRIAGARDDLAYPALAVAAAQVDVARVRRFRHERITAALRGLSRGADSGGDNFGDALKEILAILRTMKGSSGSVAPTIARLEQITARRDASRARSENVDLNGLVDALARLDRYERRTLSRRKAAIRQLDVFSL